MQKSIQNNRLQWIDISKGVAIILVVLGHTGLKSGSALYLNTFIYSFHLPLFFILSGYLFKDYSEWTSHSKSNSGGGKMLYIRWILSKRFYSLIIPYITYTIINRLWIVPLQYLHNHEVNIDLTSYLVGGLIQIRNSSQFGGVVWFLGWMFTTTILSAFVSIITENNK